MAEKLKLAIGLGATCSGCDIAVLDIHEKLLDVLEVADIVFCPTILDVKMQDLEKMPDASLVSIYHGAVRNSDNEEVAHLLRKKSAALIAFGACACFGGIPGLANITTTAEIFKEVYKDTPSTQNPEFVTPKERCKVQDFELTLPRFYERVHPLAEIVDVDYYIPACPPTPELFMTAVDAVVKGKLPPKGAVIGGEKTLCDECTQETKREKRERRQIKRIYRTHEVIADPALCFLDQGVICLGPATRSGCGAQCIKANMPCRGCMGPTKEVEDQGVKALTLITSILGLEEESSMKEEETLQLVQQIKDPLGLFYRFFLPKSILRR